MTDSRPEILPGSHVDLCPLSTRADGDQWIVGSAQTGEFISVPGIALPVIEQLAQGLSVAEVEARLLTETGQRVAVGDFAAALDDVGFVTAVDGVPRARPAPPQPSLPWLKPHHVRFLLHPAAVLLVAALLAGALAALGFRHQVPFSFHTLVWTRHSGLALAVAAAIAWAIIFLHECGHLLTARAAGAPARITLGTRLRFLVAQTDVSGIWTAPRRVRMIVYLAGLAVDLSIGLGFLLILDYAHPGGLAGQLIALTSAEALLMLAPQFMVFMRTDLYFVLQDSTRTANLYGDTLAYLRQCGRRVLPARWRPGPEPSAPVTPRRWVKAYALVVLGGSALCIVTEFTVSIPALIVIVVNGVSELGGGPAGMADGLVAVTVVAATQALWARSWWRRHGRRLPGWLTHQLPPGGRAAAGRPTG